MRKFIGYIIIISLGVGFACGPKPPSKSKTVKYSEDLSEYRPEYELEDPTLKGIPEETVAEDFPAPSSDITAQLTVLLDTLARRNAQEKYVQGFTIIIPGKNREEATEIKQEVYHLDTNLRPQLTYESPNWKVKVGQFYTRLEAQKTFATLKKEFPKALLVPDKIIIN